MLPAKIRLSNRQCPGDILMLTAAVRDLHNTFPNLQISVDTKYPWLWENNLHIVTDRECKVTSIGYKTPHQMLNNPVREHFVYAFHRSLERQFGIKINRGIPYPDIYLTAHDTPLIEQPKRPILLINAGSKSDFPTKQWPLEYFQQVVDALANRYTILQIGETRTGIHTPLKGAVNMLDKTPGRDIVRLMRQANAVLTGVSFPMHLCAALNAADGLQRKCVVIAGRRENDYWERYPDMDYLQGACAQDGCWNRWLPPVVGWKAELCTNTCRGGNGRYYAKCIYDIKPETVIECLT